MTSDASDNRVVRAKGAQILLCQKKTILRNKGLAMLV